MTAFKHERIAPDSYDMLGANSETVNMMEKWEYDSFEGLHLTAKAC